MATSPLDPFPRYSVRRYATVLIEDSRFPCAITDELKVFIPILGVCDVVGLDADKEVARIASDPVLRDGLAYLPFTLRADDGSFQEFEIACINLIRLHSWLWSIDLKDIPTEPMRRKFLVLKRDMADLIFAYYGRAMLSPDLKAEEEQFLTPEQKSRFAILEAQYHADHPVAPEGGDRQPPEPGLTISVSTEPPEVEFIDRDQRQVYRDMIGILGKLADKKKVPGDKRRGFERVEAGLKAEFGFTYYWAIPAVQWEAVVRHCIQVYQGYAGRTAILPPIFTNALKMKAKPDDLEPDQPRLF